MTDKSLELYAIERLPMRLYYKLVITAGLLSACGAQTMAPVVPEVVEQEEPLKLSEAQPPRVYISKTGVVFTILHLKQKGEHKRALVHFVGIDHPLAAKVFVVVDRDLVANDRMDVWETMFDGQYWSIMTLDHRTLKTTFKAPRSWAKMELVFDREETKSVNSAKLLDKHRREKSELEKLATLDRAFHQRAIVKAETPSRKKAAASCGQDISVRYMWDSFSDEDYLLPKHCRPGFHALARLCDGGKNVGRRVVSKVKEIRCEMGDSASIRFDSANHLTIVANKKQEKVLTLRDQLRSQLGIRRTVLKDKRGEYLVLDQYGAGLSNTPVFWGDGETMRQLRTDKTFRLVELVGAGSPVFISPRSGYWEVSCPKGARRFDEVDQIQADKILDEANFGEPIWKRREVFLARDDQGLYYYVDRASQAYGGKDYRVYRGLRGQMVKTNLIDIVDDARGKLFSTDKGNLRLLIDSLSKGKAYWMTGKKKRELTVVGEYSVDYRKLIFRDLGVYDGQELGLLCD